jgi:OOP family OmpA-OmpF porin
MMNKYFKLAAVAAAILSTQATAADADIKNAYVTGGLNMFAFDTEVHNMDKAIGPWFGFGYQIDKNWAVEFDYHMADSDIDHPGITTNKGVDISLMSLSGVYRYAPVGQNSILAKVGLGRQEYDSSANGSVTETAIRVGGGYEYYIQPNLSATFMWDLLYSIDETLIDSLPNIGLKYQFGDVKSSYKKSTKVTKSAEKPAKAKTVVMDADLDGVENSKDMCSNTPSGVRVNAQGCPFDRDADGVYDYKDECVMTPAGAKVDAKGCTVKLEEKVSIQLYISFANNSSVVPEEYSSEIQKVADFMKSYPDTKVALVGHSDSSGSAAYNQMLSEKRAAKVADYLVTTFGVDSSRVSSRGEGESNPIADNTTAEGRKKNRRVTAEITAVVVK